jgi:O-antigen/teichoic acid export membrane protein
VPSALLWALGVHAAWPFGTVFAGALLFGALVGVVALRASGGLEVHAAADAAQAEAEAQAEAAQPEPGGGNRAATSLGLLVAGNLVGQFVTNGTPLVIAPRLATAASAALGQSINAAIVLARTPLFALFPIQSLVLPKLTAAVTLGDLAAVRNRMALLVGYCSAVGVLGSVGFAVLGRWVLRTFMGIPAPVGGGTLALLGIGTTCLMAALVLQDALVALDQHRVVLLAWAAGAAVMIAVFAFPLGPVAAATAASLAGPLAVAAVMAFVVRRGTRTRRDPSFTPGSRLDSASAASS